MSSISEAAASGSRLDLLVAMRDEIAGKLDEGVPPRDLASLTRRLMEIAEDIEALEAETHGDVVSLAAATADEPWSAAS
jgi:hypothetical protein